jgi:hypothetical protein
MDASVGRSNEADVPGRPTVAVGAGVTVWFTASGDKGSLRWIPAVGPS